MKTILDWLEAAAEESPSHVAVSDPLTSLTYQELRTRAKRAGSYFAELQAKVSAHAEARALVDESSVGMHRPRACAFYLEKSTSALAALLLSLIHI